MALNAEAIAALIFLVLYSILFFFQSFLYATGKIIFRSRYTVIFIHIAIRLASQATGLASGILGYSAIDVLVAYFILSAEGYFTLVLCTYRFLIYWEVRNTPEGRSWLEPVLPPGTSIGRRIGHSFSLIGKKRHPMGIIHNLLIIGNALIITGGSKLAGASQDPTRKGDVHTAKILRLVGQSIFLAVNVFLLFCIAKAVKKFKRENGGAVHPTLFVLLAIWPLLLVRGIYGVLAGVVPSFSYFTLSNYDEHGLKGSFVASEYILGTAPEWLSCILLLSTVATSRHDPEPQVVGMGPLKDKAEG